MKRIDIVIAKTINEQFFVCIRGHMPNPNFFSHVTNQLPSYKESYQASVHIAHALTLAGHSGSIFNDKLAEKDGEV